MRVGHFAPNIGAPGGIATYVRRLGEAQTARGHDVWYLSYEDADTLPAGRLVARPNAESMYREAHRLKLDVLHLHKAAPASPEAEALVPRVRTMHGNQGSCPSGTRYLARTATACDRTYSAAGCLWGHLVDQCGRRHPQSVASHFTRYHTEQRLAASMPTITVSCFLRDRMIESGIPMDQIIAIPSPAPSVSETSALPLDGIPRMLFLGRIVPQKGLAWVIRALAQVTVPLHVDVAGDGRALDAMRELARRHGVEDRITFHGWVDSADVPGLIARSRAVVFPSIWHEPAGLVTLEAAAHGRPVIASTVGGIPEYALPEFSLQVAPNDTAGLAAAMTRLATNVDLARTMGDAGRVAARTTFAMDTFLDRVDAVYHRVLASSLATQSTALPA